ncbi:MAG: Hsp20/alpha crystallin family protein [Bacteroidota bacterium]
MTTNDKELTTKQAQETGGARRSGERQYRLPAADIFETPDAYVLMLDLPGVRKENILVQVEKGELLVRAEVVQIAGSDASVILREHVADGYDRVFSLGENVDTDSIDAHYEDGVLTLKLLKSEKIKAREITVR